jgi:HEAT repeat protein
MQRPVARHARLVFRAAGAMACLTTACLTTAGCFSTGFGHWGGGGKTGLNFAGVKSPGPVDQSSPVAPSPVAPPSAAAKSAQPDGQPTVNAEADRRPSAPPTTPAPPAGSTPPALTQATWVVNAAAPAAGENGVPVYYWRHTGLDQLLAVAPKDRCDFAKELASANPIVSANAAIALARLKNDQGIDRLAAAVRDSQLRLPLRRAAVEALASLDHPTATERLRDLLDTFGRDDSAAASNYVPELHADLLRGLARHVDAGQDPHYTTALHSPSAQVRLEAVRAWGASRLGAPPDEVVDLRTDPDPRVRAAVVVAAVALHHPRAFEFAQGAQSDFHLDVRLAGIAAMGQLGGDESQAALKRLLAREPEVVRAAVVAALAQTGDDDSVFTAAGDKSWNVRCAVAKALARHPDRQGAIVASRLIGDRSGEVRRQIVATLESWPLERSGPLLLAALEAAPYQTRKDAAAQLARRWPPARDYSADAPADRRSEVLSKLQAVWTDQFGAIDREALAALPPETRLPTKGPPAKASPAPTAAPAAAAGANVPRSVNDTIPAGETAVSAQQRAHVEGILSRLDDRQVDPEVQRKATEELAAMGPELTRVLEQLVADGGRVLPETVYRDVLPQHDPAFAALVQLASRDATERRTAAKRLAELAAVKPLPPLAVRRLADLGTREPDALTWRELIRAVQNDTSDAATRLAYAGMSHPSPEVRRLSCGHLGDCADPRHAAILVGALDDQNSSVVRAAVEALSHVGELADTRPLERLLTTNDKPLRVEVAATLARCGAAAGPPALERLAHDADPKIRRQVVAAMGLLGGPEYTFTLIELLDDELGVRVAALASLTQITKQDFSKESGEQPAGLSDQVARWKRWWQTHGEVGSRTSEAR